MDVWVHIDVALAMSGVSLFGQRSAPAATASLTLTAKSTREGGSVVWSFDKAGFEEDNFYYNNDDDAHYTKYTHLLTENRNKVGYSIVGVARGRPRFDLGMFRVVTEDFIFVLERDGWIDEEMEVSMK